MSTLEDKTKEMFAEAIDKLGNVEFELAKLTKQRKALLAMFAHFNAGEYPGKVYTLSVSNDFQSRIIADLVRAMCSSEVIDAVTRPVPIRTVKAFKKA